MKLGIVISTNEPETVCNALRLGDFALGKGDSVRVFLLGRGVELDRIRHNQFDVGKQAESFLAAGGRIMACGTCLKLRDSAGSDVCPLSSMQDLYELILDAGRVVSF